MVQKNATSHYVTVPITHHASREGSILAPEWTEILELAEHFTAGSLVWGVALDTAVVSTGSTKPKVGYKFASF